MPNVSARGRQRRQLTESTINLNDTAFDFDNNAAINDQKKRDEEAEKRRKEREDISKRNNAADSQRLKNQLAPVEKAYADTLWQIIRVIGMGSKKDSHFMGRVSIQRQQWLSQRNESLGKLSKTINDR